MMYSSSTSAPPSAPARGRVVVALAVAAVAISFAAIFFRLAKTPPLTASAIRLTLSAAFLLPWAARGWRRRLPTKSIVIAGAWGGVAYALHFFAWVTSLGLTSVAASTTLVTTTPLLLAGWDRLHGRRVHPSLLTALPLGLVGVTLIAGADWSLSGLALQGDVLALAGAVAMAAYLTLAGKAAPHGSALEFSALAVSFGALWLWVLIAATGGETGPPTPQGWLYLALAAAVPQVIGHTLLTWAVRHTEPAVVGMATVAEPAGSTLLAWVWLGEPLGPLVAAGATITLAATLIALRGARLAPDDDRSRA